MPKKAMQVLLMIEDNPGDVRLLKEMFAEQGLRETEVTHVESLAEAEQYLALRTADVILVDLKLPDANGLESVRRAHAAAPACRSWY